MSRLSGLASAAIFVGLVFVLVYLCCRVKRRGVVVQRNGLQFMPGDACPQGATGGLGLGYPQSSGPFTPPFQSHVYGHNSMTSPATSNSNSYPTGVYPNIGSNTSPHLPYPLHGAGSMPMPMTNNTTTAQHQNIQNSAAYPTASAPSDFDDLPPPYESVVRQT